MAVHVRTVVRLLAPLLVAAALLVPASAPAEPADCERLAPGTDVTWTSLRPEGGSTCVTLSYPERAVVRPVGAVGEEAGWLSVVNAADEELCGSWAWEAGRCRLEGPGPYRLVRAGGTAGTPVHVAVARLDRPAGCTELALGDWGTDEGTTVDLPAGQVAACLSFPTAELRRPTLVAWERRAGSGVAEVLVRDRRPETCWRNPSPPPAGHGSLTCYSPEVAHDGDRSQVLVRTSALGARWRVVRRSPGVSDGCVPAASTVPGGPASTGTVESSLAIDCVRVTGAPTDRFVVDTVDDGAGLAVQTYGSDGRPTCPGRLPDTDPCQVDLDVEHLVTVGASGPLDRPTAYALDTWKVETLTGWAPQCTRLEDYTGSFTRGGVLDDDRTGECVVLEDGGAAEYRFDTAQAAGLDLAVVPAGGPPEEPRCEDEAPTSRTCSVVGGAHDDSGVLLVRRADGADREALPYEVGVECLQPGWCESLPWTPTAAPVVDGPLHVGDGLRATTGGWSPSQPDGFRYLWLVDGVPVRADTVLGPGTVGHEVRVRVQATEGSIADGDVALSAPVTVRRGPAPVLIDRPELRGGTRVGRLAGVARGTWDPEARRTEYRWRVDGRLLRETGPRIWLERRMAGSRVTVREVARVPGLRPGRAFVGAFRVRRR